MEQIIDSMTPMTDTDPITVTGRETKGKYGIFGVVFMHLTLTVLFLLAAVMLNIIDKDLFSRLKDEFIRLANKDTEEIFVSITDYIQSFIRL